MTPPIAIIGGGPSGLTFARLLKCNGIDYIVYERNASATATTEQLGGSLDLHGPTGQLALKSAGLFDEFQKYARWDATTTLVADKYGKTHMKFGEGRDAPEIDRVQLRRLLLESIPEDKVCWDHAVKSTHRDESGNIVITFLNGATASGFKLVVGADGAWSRVRHLLTPAKPSYSGKQYFEARLSANNPFYPSLSAKVGHGILMAMGDNKQISAQQMFDGSYRIYLGFSAPEDFARSGPASASGDAAREFFLSSPDFYADWAQDLKDIVANCEGAFRPWPLYYLPAEAMGWQRVAGVTLLGDAAHVSTPFVGEGVNCAMYDALVLATKIKECGMGALEQAVVEYERDMFARAKDLIKRCHASAKLLFAEDAPKELVRALGGDGERLVYAEKRA